MPTDELEHELRLALAAAAAGYQHPEQARQRLLQHNYRPGSGHRRLTTGIAAAAVAGSVMLGLGLSGSLGSSPAPGTGTIRTAAFTLTRNANGTATLTINPQVLSDPGALQADLAQYGIPAKVTTGSFCSSDPAPSGFSQVVTFSPAFQGDGGQQQVDNPTVTINPAAMPAGTELSVGAFQAANGDTTALALMDTTSYTCTSTTPTAIRQRGAAVGKGRGIGNRHSQTCAAALQNPICCRRCCSALRLDIRTQADSYGRLRCRQTIIADSA